MKAAGAGIAAVTMQRVPKRVLKRVRTRRAVPEAVSARNSIGRAYRAAARGRIETSAGQSATHGAAQRT